jgi:hypothetical protein
MNVGELAPRSAGGGEPAAARQGGLAPAFQPMLHHLDQREAAIPRRLWDYTASLAGGLPGHGQG